MWCFVRCINHNTFLDQGKEKNNYASTHIDSGLFVLKRAADDIDFISILIGTVQHQVCVDERRIVAVGMSSGA